MSHYLALVDIGTDIPPGQIKRIEARVGDILAKFDENQDVDSHREYEQDLIDHLYGDAWKLAGAEIAGPRPDFHQIEDEPAAERTARHAQFTAERNAWNTKVLANLTVEQTLSFLNEHEEDEADPAWGFEEGKGYYHTTTRNPDGKWDYWRIGGRYSGSLTVIESAPLARPRFVAWEYSFNDPKLRDIPHKLGEGLPIDQADKLGSENPYAGRRVDVAMKGDIDVDGLRARHQADRREMLAKYDGLIASGVDERKARWEADFLMIPVPEDREAWIHEEDETPVHSWAIVTREGWRDRYDFPRDGQKYTTDEASWKAWFKETYAAIPDNHILVVVDYHS